jgi:hypothetical protein
MHVERLDDGTIWRTGIFYMLLVPVVYAKREGRWEVGWGDGNFVLICMMHQIRKRVEGAIHGN